VSLHDVAELVAICGAVVVAALLLQPLSTRFRIPDPLLFLAGGVALGAVPRIADAVDGDVLNVVGTLALIVILTSGGLGTGMRSLRRVLVPVLALGVGGTLVTFAVAAVVAHEVAGLPWSAALILGAVVAPNDPAAVFSALAGQASRLGRIAHVLEGEAGLNDPIAIALAIAFVDAAADGAVLEIAGTTAVEGAVGVAGGIVAGVVLTRILGPLRPTIAAAPALTVLAGAFLTFGGTALLHGSGFVAVYLYGLVVADREFPERPQVAALHAELAHLGEVAMFVLLGVAMTQVPYDGVLFDGFVVGVLILVVLRPLIAYPTLTVLGYARNEALFGSIAGLRGAVPILLASLPLAAGLADGERILALTSVVVVLSLVTQGVPLGRIAGRLFPS
jgi:potassium/hydrogen antiporter